MRVIEIVRAHLVANGFDGLVEPDAECGCLLDDLQPCGASFATCKPGYRFNVPHPEGGDWTISTNKDWKPTSTDL